MESMEGLRNKGSRNRDATIILRHLYFAFNDILFKNLSKKYLVVTIKILSYLKVCTSKVNHLHIENDRNIYYKAQTM